MTRPAKNSRLTIGSYGPDDRPGIHSFDLAPDGALVPAGSYAGIANPSFVAVHPAGDLLYAVSEIGTADCGRHGSVHAVRIGSLTDLGSRSSGGDHPCHISIDPGGRFLAVSNYGSGSVATFPILAGGALGEMVSLVRHSGSGPNAKRQQGPHVHSSLFSPDGRFLLVADLGIDRVAVYRFDAGELRPHREYPTRPGAGPRHMAFDASGNRLFVVNELDNTLGSYRYSAGELKEDQVVSTLPPGVDGGQAADLRVSGRHLLVSNRGHDSIAVFALDPELELLAVRPCGGSWPRSFAVAGDHLVVANEHSDEVAVLPLLGDSPWIGEPKRRVEIPQPTCVMVG